MMTPEDFERIRQIIREELHGRSGGVTLAEQRKLEDDRARAQEMFNRPVRRRKNNANHN